MGISYTDFLWAFAKAVNVDYSKLRETGNAIASKLNEKQLIHVHDANGTDLTFNIDKRRVGVEVGTLEDCLSGGRECEAEVPSGEVYVAPIETSANGVLVVEEFRDYDIKKLELHFKAGKIKSFKAEKGKSVFRDLLEGADGDKDRIAEFGVGINYGMKPIGYRIYDEKALGTIHIAIGNNVHLGGVNRASIHYDFVLYNPNVEADNESVMREGRIAS
jgi:leucyl aminopeptidase (aminopeptidase T)